MASTIRTNTQAALIGIPRMLHTVAWRMVHHACGETRRSARAVVRTLKGQEQLSEQGAAMHSSASEVMYGNAKLPQLRF